MSGTPRPSGNPGTAPPVNATNLGLDEAASAEVQGLRRASELLAEVLHDVQGRLARESVAALMLPDQRERKARPQPTPYVDLAPYDGMADREVLLALGARKDEVNVYKAALQRERAGRYLLGTDDAGRCQAGLATQLGLRCRRTAIAGEKWCRQHHPDPPADAMAAAVRRRQRLRRQELWPRPDGRVLEALYDLTDSVQEMTDAWRDLADRVRRLEPAVAGISPRPGSYGGR